MGLPVVHGLIPSHPTGTDPFSQNSIRNFRQAGSACRKFFLYLRNNQSQFPADYPNVRQKRSINENLVFQSHMI